MSKTKTNLSMVDLVESYLIEKKELTIDEIISYVFESKKLDKTNIDLVTNFYMDLTTSGKFVYCGQDKWALKKNNLDFWDKDGHAFTDYEEEPELDVEDDLDFTEFNLEDIELPSEKESLEEESQEEEKEPIETPLSEEMMENENRILREEKIAEEEEKEYIEAEVSMKTTDEEDDSEASDQYDEDDYNEIMDDYEELYED
jgi:DNA-directed RNA polymerase subunit delta